MIGFTNGIAHADRLDADQGLFRADDRRGAERVSAAHDGCWRSIRRRLNWRRWGWALGRWRLCCCCRASPSGFRRRLWRCWFARRRRASFICRWRRSAASSAGFRRGCRLLRFRIFTAEHILPLIPSAFTVAMLAALESMLSAVVADGMTRRPAQLQRGTGGAGNREYCFAAVWRDSGDGRDCADGDEHPVGRAVAGCRHGACADAAADSAGGGAAGQLHPAGDAGGGAVRGGLQHGRVEGDWRHSCNWLSRRSRSGW